ncbi:hypothetical protein C7271_17435 [filamentous cyanobacterium CCP5]|nr:hypothetical protein C7271_17435 [filamentous cyanobacterium CCP5]
MALQDLEADLLALPPVEKVRAIQLLTQSIGGAWRGIEKVSGVCGGDACVANTRIPVWGLVEARRAGYSEADLLVSYPALTASDLVNAWMYEAAYPEEIEAAIQENEAA